MIFHLLYLVKRKLRNKKDERNTLTKDSYSRYTATSGEHRVQGISMDMAQDAGCKEGTGKTGLHQGSWP
jgi:hypothetical protein